MSLIIIDDSYIDTQIEWLENFGSDALFDDSEYGDIMIEFVYRDYAAFKKWVSMQQDFSCSPLVEYCKNNFRDFIAFVCNKYCSLAFVLEYEEEEKSIYRSQAEIMFLIDSKNIQYMNQLRKEIKSDESLLDAFNDYDFHCKLKNYLFSKRLKR